MGGEGMWWEAGAFENLGLQMWWPRCAVVVSHDSQGQVLVESSGLDMRDGRREILRRCQLPRQRYFMPIAPKQITHTLHFLSSF